MSSEPQKKKYEKHIELAIQHVLDKVKNPEKFTNLQRLKSGISPTPKTPNTSQTPNPPHPLDSFGEELLPTKPEKPTRNKTTLNDAQKDDKLAAKSLAPDTEHATEDAHEAPEDKAPLQTEASIEAPSDDTVYLEAEDLYTPVPLEQEEEVELEEPEDVYVPPFNLFEEFVETELDILLSRYVDLCRCSQCRADIVALALQQLPAYYVTGTRGMFTAKNMIHAKYTQKIIEAVTKGIHIIYKRPRTNCKKIKQYIWVKPDIEEIKQNDSPPPQETSSLFEAIYDEDIEVEFSDEITDIIKTLEEVAPKNEDAHNLLPVTSPHVAKAYQQTEKETKSTATNDDQTDGEIPKDTTMQLIDDWD